MRFRLWLVPNKKNMNQNLIGSYNVYDVNSVSIKKNQTASGHYVDIRINTDVGYIEFTLFGTNREKVEIIKEIQEDEQ
mgnify:CR=1 FL=1